MYDNGFVVAIRVQDRFVEEKNGNFVVPFDSEYSIRLKNRNNRKAIARIYIDGEEVNKLGSFILDANSSLDLERFVADLNEGDKFKFVPLSNSKVKDRNNGENGVVEARFQLVKPVETPIIYDHQHHHHYHNNYYHYPHNFPYWYATNTGGYSGGGMMCSSASPSSAEQPNNLVSNYCSNECKGATIGGASSGQKFSYSYIGELEDVETVIIAHLLGTNDASIKEYYTKVKCSKCGKKYGLADLFCSSCGEKR